MSITSINQSIRLPRVRSVCRSSGMQKAGGGGLSKLGALSAEERQCLREIQQLFQTFKSRGLITKEFPWSNDSQNCPIPYAYMDLVADFVGGQPLFRASREGRFQLALSLRIIDEQTPKFYIEDKHRQASLGSWEGRENLCLALEGFKQRLIEWGTKYSTKQVQGKTGSNFLSWN